VPGRRRGARTGRGWDASPPRPRPAKSIDSGLAAGPGLAADPGLSAPGYLDGGSDTPLWFDDEADYRAAAGDAAGREAPAPGAGKGSAPGREQDLGERAREICLRLLSVRPRTRVELGAALRRHGIPDEVADAVLDRYDEVGLIDDEAFARAWVTSRHHGRGLSRRALAGELRRKGVDTELVGAALEEVDPETEATTARDLVDRRLRSVGSAPPEVVLRRLVGMLARKGYQSGLAYRVVKEALAEAADERTAGYADLIDPDSVDDLVGDSDDPIR
jgi:regulatory protein